MTLNAISSLSNSAQVVARSILLVDDDVAARNRLARRLDSSGMFVTVCADRGEQALSWTDDRHFDAFVVEVALPDMDGRDLCRLLRRRGVCCPIVMTSRPRADADVHTVLSLDSGAIDHVVKPLRPEVLMARLRAHLRQYVRRDDATIHVGRFVFHVGMKRLVDVEQNRAVPLTASEAAILKRLYRSDSRFATRAELLAEVLGYSVEAQTHTVETHVYRLRRKLERDPSRPEVLVTVPGGYRLQIPARNI